MKPTLIIADDMSATREALRRALEEDFEVLALAQDGSAAVEVSVRFGPQLVLLDVVMPKLSGIDAASRIRLEVAPTPKIVFLSALTDPVIVAKAFEAGACDYIFKPIDIKKISASLWACVRTD